MKATSSLSESDVSHIQSLQDRNTSVVLAVCGSEIGVVAWLRTAMWNRT